MIPKPYIIAFQTKQCFFLEQVLFSYPPFFPSLWTVQYNLGFNSFQCEPKNIRYSRFAYKIFIIVSVIGKKLNNQSDTDQVFTNHKQIFILQRQRYFTQRCNTLCRTVIMQNNSVKTVIMYKQYVQNCNYVKKIN